MKKHAFLIMVHRNDEVLETLLKLLDDERNDIFIHIDAKAALRMEELKRYIKKSGFYQAERVRVNWGGYSQIQAELNLLEAAAGQESYARYHLLSGADLPIKTQDEIHQFFDAHGEKEFVGFCGGIEGCEERVKLYHLFQEKVRRGNRPRLSEGAEAFGNQPDFKRGHSISERIELVQCYRCSSESSFGRKRMDKKDV